MRQLIKDVWRKFGGSLIDFVFHYLLIVLLYIFFSRGMVILIMSFDLTHEFWTILSCGLGLILAIYLTFIIRRAIWNTWGDKIQKFFSKIGIEN